jgi:predicted nucleotidyltransferase
MTGRLSALQAATLDRMLAVLKGDARIDAVLAGGSLAQGSFDRHSDLDLIVVVRKDALDAVLRDRRTLATQAGELLTAFVAEHLGDPRLLICLFGPPLVHIDLKFVTEAELENVVEQPDLLWARDMLAVERRIVAAGMRMTGRDPQWFEDRIWAWLHYGATKLHRGELFEAISTLDFCRGKVLGPLLQREAGLPPRGVRRIEDIPGATSRLACTIAGPDRMAIRVALECAAQLYLELRQAAPPPVLIAHMPQSLLEFIDKGA